MASSSASVRTEKSDQAVTKRVFLWSLPRSISTAFEFAIRTLPNVKVFHNPYTVPYFSVNQLSAVELAASSPCSFEDADKCLQADYPGKDTVFAKVFPTNLRGRYDIMLDEGFKGFTHSFLIRNPKDIMLSLYRKFNDFKTWQSFYERGDMSFVVFLDFYYYLKRNLSIDPVIIDADDLLDNPEGVMKAYCERVGINYREGMTKWEPDSMPVVTQDLLEQKKGMFDISWNEAALKSTGIQRPPPSSVPTDDLPPVVLQCIEEYLVPYNELYKLRLVL